MSRFLRFQACSCPATLGHKFPSAIYLRLLPHSVNRLLHNAERSELPSLSGESGGRHPPRECGLRSFGALHWCDRQRKGKFRTFIRAALDPNVLTMRTHDLTGNRKSHACAFEVLPTNTAIELFEDSGLFVLADAWSLIGHVNDHTFLTGVCANQNRTTRPRVLHCVINQMRDHQHY